jgi:hypothetical protein
MSGSHGSLAVIIQIKKKNSCSHHVALFKERFFTKLHIFQRFITTQTLMTLHQVRLVSLPPQKSAYMPCGLDGGRKAAWSPVAISFMKIQLVCKFEGHTNGET